MYLANDLSERPGRTARLKAKMEMEMEEMKNLFKKNSGVTKSGNNKRMRNQCRIKPSNPPASFVFVYTRAHTQSLEGFHQFHQPKPCYISMHVSWFLLFISCNRIPLLLFDLMLFCPAGCKKERSFFLRPLFFTKCLAFIIRGKFEF